MKMFFLQAQQVLTDTLSKAGKSEFFKQVDPFGLGMTVIGYAIVFIALLLLYIVFYNLTKVIQLKLRRFLRKEGVIDKEFEEIECEVNLVLHSFLFRSNRSITFAFDRENKTLALNMFFFLFYWFVFEILKSLR